MAIELKITVNHATDLAAEVQQLAQIIGGASEMGNVVGATSTPVALTTAAPSPSQPVSQVSTSAPAHGGKSDAPKTLARKEQDVAVAEMIAAGTKDDRFELLTKGRQNEVEAALAKANVPADEEKSDDADLDDMFTDSAPVATVTRQMVSDLMAKVGKDEDGNPIQPRLLKIREILVDNIPEGQDIKVKSLPEDKLATVYALIQKIGA